MWVDGQLRDAMTPPPTSAWPGHARSLLCITALAGTTACASTVAEKPPSTPERIAIADYAALTRAVESGDLVRAVIHFARCRLKADGNESPGPNAVGGMDLGTFESFAPMLFNNPHGFLAASEARLISHARYGYVLDYVKLRIYDDDRVDVVAQYLDPKTFELKMDELFECRLGAQGGVELSYVGAGAASRR